MFFDVDVCPIAHLDLASELNNELSRDDLAAFDVDYGRLRRRDLWLTQSQIGNHNSEMVPVPNSVPPLKPASGAAFHKLLIQCGR